MLCHSAIQATVVIECNNQTHVKVMTVRSLSQVSQAVFGQHRAVFLRRSTHFSQVHNRKKLLLQFVLSLSLNFRLLRCLSRNHLSSGSLQSP